MRKQTTILLLFFLFCPALSIAATADFSPGEDLLPKLEQFYRGLDSMTFTFVQSTRSGGRIRRGQGKGLFIRPTEPERPVVMRWDYEQPEKQVIINDGREITIYTPARKQVLITPVTPDNSDITSALFSSTRSLADEFRTEPVEDRFTFSLPPITLTRIRLVPRVTRPQLRAVQLWVDPQMRIRHLLIEDHLDTVTELTFSDIRLNPVQSRDERAIARILALDLPPDTEIIRQ